LEDGPEGKGTPSVEPIIPVKILFCGLGAAREGTPVYPRCDISESSAIILGAGSGVKSAVGRETAR
jgi:hypothetical protein